jgi:methionine-rich copper-binding protein CopC
MSAATSGECAENEYFAGLNTDTIALDCEPVKVIYNETTVTVTDADVPESGSAEWTGECPASHPIAGSGTMFYPSTNESGVDNRPTVMRNAPFSLRPPDSRGDSFSMAVGQGSYDPFSITVTFMTQCWTAPTTYGDTINPTLFSASPADDETGVAGGKSIVLNFSEKVDAETGNVTIYRTSDSTVVETISVSGSQVTGSGTSTITVNPADDLAYATEYYVLIDATAFDDASENSYAGLSDSTALSFTTATVPEAPTELQANQVAATTIQLVWIASSDGGSLISEYILETSSDSGETWVAVSLQVGCDPAHCGELNVIPVDEDRLAVIHWLSGLEAETTYTFRVSAVNAVGTGSPSDSLNVATTA